MLPVQGTSLAGKGEEVCSVGGVIDNALQQVLLVSQLVWAVVQLTHLLGRLYPEALGYLHPNLYMWHTTFQGEKNERKEKTTPFGLNLMRSQVLYRASQAQFRDVVHMPGTMCVSPITHQGQNTQGVP